jgi:serine/threonine protein kinase
VVPVTRYSFRRSGRRRHLPALFQPLSFKVRQHRHQPRHAKDATKLSESFLSIFNLKMGSEVLDVEASRAPKKEDIPEEGPEYARKHFERSLQGTSMKDLFDDFFPKFNLSEITLGKMLGQGGFSTVTEILAFDVGKPVNPCFKSQLFPLPPPIKIKEEEEEEESTTDEKDADALEEKEMATAFEEHARMFLAEHCLRKTGDSRYAIKAVTGDLKIRDETLYTQGMADIAIEARFLSNMQHPNIVKLRSVGKMNPFSSEYFIVLDRLYDTLRTRMKKWSARRARSEGMIGLLSYPFSLCSTKRITLYEERVVAAFDLAAALAYIHKLNILHRDIKSDNAGFDVRGDIKLFDFGFAKELLPHLKNDDNTYKLTGW